MPEARHTRGARTPPGPEPTSSSLDAADEMLALVRELYPLPRSITGDGLRATLDRIAERLPAPLERHEVPSGTPVLDWSVPPEWNVREAWIADLGGRRLVDARDSSLHLLGYSEPVPRRRIGRAELDAHLYSLPEHPEWTPYRTSHYERAWGFCLPQRLRDAMTDPEYEVHIDATLAPGHLSYGELLLPGERDEEILLSAHSCHPALANDNLSGIAVAVALARRLHEGGSRRYGVRLLFAPGTIGAITWLARNRERAGRIVGGLTLVGLGDAAPLRYKSTIGGAASIDRAAAHVLDRRGGAAHPFEPYGYDERQYNAPGFRLPVGSLTRGGHGGYPEYHTSADTPELLSRERLAAAYEAALAIVEVLQEERVYRSRAPFGEPQLGRRGVYRSIAGMEGAASPDELTMAMLWVLQLADGAHSLLDVAERAALPFERVREAAELLRSHELLEEAPPPALAA